MTVLLINASEMSLSVLDPDKMVMKKVGREKGAAAYSKLEHTAQLSIISEVSKAFNSGESSPQWVAVYKRTPTQP